VHFLHFVLVNKKLPCGDSLLILHHISSTSDWKCQ